MDFTAAEIFFKEYLKDYDLNNGSIILKVKHTFEVVKLSEYIAKGLDLGEEDVELAKIIAILHDLGRFEQIKTFGTFDDSKLEHAQFGVKVLFEQNLIRKIFPTDEYDSIIEKAIYNHNKYEIEEGLNERELLHAKMIRDADKLDVFRVFFQSEFKDLFPRFYEPDKTLEEYNISPIVYEDFMSHRCVNVFDRKNILDCFVCTLAFIFDLNFDISLQYVYDKDIVNQMVNRLGKLNDNTQIQIDKIKKCAVDFINSTMVDK